MDRTSGRKRHGGRRWGLDLADLSQRILDAAGSPVAQGGGRWAWVATVDGLPWRLVARIDDAGQHTVVLSVHRRRKEPAPGRPDTSA